jgi:site-specific recombinase XerD
MTAELMIKSVENLPADERAAEIVRIVAREAPSFADLPFDDQVKVAQAVMAQNIGEDVKRRVRLEKIDYPAERQAFLSRARKSAHTVKAYTLGLAALDEWCARHGLAALEMGPAEADDWIESMRDRSSSVVRLRIAAASAFWNWLERRHPKEQLRNPFRGTRAKPKNKYVKRIEVPDKVEIKALLSAADPVLRAAIMCMAERGFRVGALPSLSIAGGRWWAETKGHEQRGDLPDSARRAIERAGLPLRAPFAELTAAHISGRFAYLVERLEKAGTIRARYSVHDLRHAFAVRLYEESKHDLRLVKKALGHSGISTTERYLRSLDADV